MKRRLRLWVKVLGWCAACVVVLLLAAAIGGMVLYSRYEQRASKFDLSKIDDVAERSAIYDGNGELYSYFGGENRLTVPLSAVSKFFIDALIAREDSRFWEHRGVDFRSVFRAAVANALAGRTKQGASTITQQLARNACGLRARTLDRKALEAVLARHIEAHYTKEQILEFYVNRIYFGSGFYGIERAARGYFNKPASDLDLGESAMLAALIRNPNRLAPSRDLDAALAERNVVLDRMQELKLITRDDADAAKARQVKVAKRSEGSATNDYVMDAVLAELSSILAPETIDFGGLTVYTAIDPQLQRLAQEAADRRLEEIESQKHYPHPKKRDFMPAAEGEEKATDYLQAAVVIIDNRTGGIRAVVGGRDHAQSSYSRALLAKRQVGSTFKPFVYATAFEHGMLPGTMVDDARISPGEFGDLPKKWSPENSDGEYGGLQPASVGLLKSRNTMSIRVGEFAGLPRVREVAEAAGLAENIPDLPVVFLGGFETTVKNLTAAYTVFPNLGTYRAPSLISSVRDREGRELWKAPNSEKRVMSADSAWMVSRILQDVMKSGTAAKSASLGWKKPGAGKTGTTNDFFDAWFVGYTSSLTCGVWVGMDQPQTIMEKGYGSALALPIWVEVMQHVPETSYPAAPFEPPTQLTKVVLCSVSGLRATAGCVAKGCSYETQLPASRVPGELCRTHPEVSQVVVQTPAPTVVPPAPAVPAVSSVSSPASPPPVASLPVPQPTPTPFTRRAAPMPPAPAPAAVALEPIAEPPIPSTPAPRVIRSARMPVQPPPAAAPSRPTILDEPAEREVRPAAPVPLPMDRPDRISSHRVEQVPSPTRSRPVPAATPIEVRRALPVEQSPETVPAADDGVAERRIVEKLPDGQTRTTIIRQVPSRHHSERKERDKDDDDDDDDD